MAVLDLPAEIETRLKLILKVWPYANVKYHCEATKSVLSFNTDKGLRLVFHTEIAYTLGLLLGQQVAKKRPTLFQISIYSLDEFKAFLSLVKTRETETIRQRASRVFGGT